MWTDLTSSDLLNTFTRMVVDQEVSNESQEQSTKRGCTGAFGH